MASRGSHLVVVWRELMEQLFDAIFLSWAVHVGHPVLRQRAVVMINLHTHTRARARMTTLRTGTCTPQTHCCQLPFVSSVKPNCLFRPFLLKHQKEVTTKERRATSSGGADPGVWRLLKNKIKGVIFARIQIITLAREGVYMCVCGGRGCAQARKRALIHRTKGET